jgi:hypothetical protein
MFKWGRTILEFKVNVLSSFSLCFTCSLGPPFPCLELTDPDNEKLIKDLVTFLELRMNKKNLLLKDWQQKCEYYSLPLFIIIKIDVIKFSCSYRNVHCLKGKILLMKWCQKVRMYL